MPALRSPRVRTRLTNPSQPPPEPAVVFVYAPTTAAARPPTPPGRGLHRATDTGQVTYFDSIAWRPVTVRGSGLVEVSGGDFVSPARSAATVVGETLGGMIASTPEGGVLVHDGAGGLVLCTDDVAALLGAANAGAMRGVLSVYSTTQVDNALSLLAGGVAAKPNIQAATTGPIADLTTVTLASVFSDYVPVAGDRVLVKDNASPDGVAPPDAAHNGWYLVGIVGGGVAPLTRVSDANSSGDFVGVTTCIIASGSLAGKQYKTGQAASFVLGTDPITFTEIPATPLGTATPQDLGTASPGSSGAASPEDHVHAMPTPAQVGAVPVARTIAGLSLNSDLTVAALAGAMGFDRTDTFANRGTATAGLHGQTFFASDLDAAWRCIHTGGGYAWRLTTAPRAVPAGSPYLHWPITNGSSITTVANTGSATSADLTLTNVGFDRDDTTGTAFDGSGADNVYASGAAQKYPPGSAVTVAFRLKLRTTNTNYGRLLTRAYRTSGWTSPYSPLSIRQDPSGAGRLAIDITVGADGAGAVASYLVSASYLLPRGRWCSVVVTHDGATGDLLVYLDGVLVGTFTTTVAAIDWNSAVAGKWYLLGNEHESGTGTNGLMADVRVYPVVQTAAWADAYHRLPLGTL